MMILEKKIAEMKTYVPNDGEGSSNPYLAVMGKGKKGRRRLLGRGVTDKKLKEVNGGSSYVVSGPVMDDLKKSIVEELRKDADEERTRLAEMFKEQEEENLRKKAELINMQNELDKQRQQMTEDIMAKIIGKLPADVVKQYLCPPSGSSSRSNE